MIKVRHTDSSEAFTYEPGREVWDAHASQADVIVRSQQGFLQTCRKSCFTIVEPVKEWEDVKCPYLPDQVWARIGYYLDAAHRLYWNGTQVVLQRRKV